MDAGVPVPNRSSEPRVLWSAPADAPGLARVTLTVRNDTVFLSILERVRRDDRGGLWLRPACAFNLSLRRGRLDVYEVSSRSSPTVRNLSPWPAALTRPFYQLYTAARHDPRLRQACLAATADALLERAAALGRWTPAEPHRLGVVDTVAALSYPLLGHALEQGATAPEHIPGSVSSGLRRTSARAAAAELFGAKATRPVVRTLAQALVDGPSTAWSDQRPEVDLSRIELATAARSSLTPDHLAAILGTVRSITPPPLDLDREQTRTARRFFAPLPPRRVMAMVEEALHGGHGGQMLLDTLRMWARLGQPDPVTLPRRLRALHDQLTEMVTAATVPALPLDAFPAELCDLDGRQVGDLRLVVPADTRQLAGWGHVMGNCIGSYTQAAWTGATWLLGVERKGELVYNIEITPGRGIRQFVGRHNRPADPADAAVLTAALHDAGVFAARGRRRARHPALAAGDVLVEVF